MEDDAGQDREATGSSADSLQHNKQQKQQNSDESNFVFVVCFNRYNRWLETKQEEPLA